MVPPPAPPVLTVVIPTLNRRELLEETLSALLRQVTPEVEVIVVDDGSSDGTIEMLNHRFGEQVQVLVQTHGGVCRARNLGVKHAKGAYLAFLDSDDLPMDQWVERFLTEAKQGADVFTAAAEFRYEDGHVRLVTPEPRGDSFGGIACLFLAGTFMVQRDVFEKAGGYLDGLTYGENTDLGMHIGDIVRREGLSARHSCDPILVVRAKHRIYDAARSYDTSTKLLARSGPLLAREPRVLAIHLAGAGVAASRLGRRREAIRLLWTAWCAYPWEWRNGARMARAALTWRRPAYSRTGLVDHVQ
jgi:glycosyltransferase involved in cell wall biosynthesis